MHETAYMNISLSYTKQASMQMYAIFFYSLAEISTHHHNNEFYEVNYFKRQRNTLQHSLLNYDKAMSIKW